MEKEIIKLTQDIWEVKTELKYLVDSFKELKEINKIVVQVMERQNNFAERIRNLETSELNEIKKLILKNWDKIRSLEDTRLKWLSYAVTWSVFLSIIFSKLPDVIKFFQN